MCADGGRLGRFGGERLGRWPFSATSGQYSAIVTGSAGAVIPGATVFRADDSAESPGMLFQIVGGDYVLTGTDDLITVIALTGGLISRLAAGNTLTTTSPILNVDNVITVDDETVTPVDAEDIELYREKIREKVQLIPGSWSAVDYRLVGSSITGIAEVSAYAHPTQPNEVNVFLQGTTAVASPGPSCPPSVVTEYTDALELVRPLGVWDVHYASCPINNVDITIVMGTFPSFTTAQQALIATALTQFVNSVRPFIAAADNIAERNDKIATF